MNFSKQRAMIRTEFKTKDDLEGFLVELDLAGRAIVHRIECRKCVYIVHYSKDAGK